MEKIMKEQEGINTSRRELFIKIVVPIVGTALIGAVVKKVEGDLLVKMQTENPKAFNAAIDLKKR